MKKIEILLFCLLLPLYLLEHLFSHVLLFIPLALFVLGQLLIWTGFMSKKIETIRAVLFSMLFCIETIDYCEGTLKTVFMGISFIHMVFMVYFFYKEYTKNN